VSVRQPGVEREDRHLDGEGEEESEEEPERGAAGKSDGAGCDQMLKFGEVKGSRLGVEPDDGRQHEDRGDHGVKEKLDGGIDAALVSEDADDERHGNESGFQKK